MQEIIDNNYKEINAKLKELEGMHDFIDFEDKNSDGINDIDQLQTDEGIEIIE